MTKRGTISSIQVSSREEWIKKPYLTLDVDWANDDVLADSASIIAEYDVPATWFITHDTEFLSSLRANADCEIGIHPNFNRLLAGDTTAGRNAREVVDGLLNIVPEAKSVRSHSTTSSSALNDMFVDRGLTHECNSFIPIQSDILLKPYFSWSQLICVPYNWEDDVHLLYQEKSSSLGSPYEVSSNIYHDGLKVFDFHPIHIFLNTESLDRYERTRHLHHNPKELIKYRYDGYGTRSRLIDLLEVCGQS